MVRRPSSFLRIFITAETQSAGLKGVERRWNKRKLTDSQNLTNKKHAWNKKQTIQLQLHATIHKKEGWLRGWKLKEDYSKTLKAKRDFLFFFFFFFFFGLDYSSWTTTITIFLECKVRRNINIKEISVTTEEMLDKCFIAGLENGRGPLADESWIYKIGRTLSKAFRKKKM